MNEITIDIKDLLSQPDNSICDVETIRQIGLATTKHGLLSKEDAIALGRKIKVGFGYAALYPHYMMPYDAEVADAVTKEGQRVLMELRNKMKENERKEIERKIGEAMMYESTLVIHLGGKKEKDE